MSQERSLTNRKLFNSYFDKKLEDGTKITLEGWVRSNRNNGSVGFIEFNDGSYFKNIQIVYTKESAHYEEFTKAKYGSAIQVSGSIRLTPEMKQPFEIQGEEVVVLGDCAEDYPLQKKKTSFEFLRDIAYLRPRANTFQAVYRVRNALAFAVHKFFQERGFIYVQTPEITSNDAEGAGQVFHVCSDLKHPDEFFGTSASLTVSGQLHAEAFALAFRDVYTFGPTFRAENSNTNRHACEFWMIEPEMAFYDLDDDMDIQEDFVKYLLNWALTKCRADLEFFDKRIQKGLIESLEKVANAKFVRISYTDAIAKLEEAAANGAKFEFKPYWGCDIATEHERYLTEKIFGCPVMVFNYPKEIKSFYMKQNPDGKTVKAVDVLVPGIGELIGGSEREENYDKLMAAIKERGMDEKIYDWYMDLRKFGTVPHSGFGLGFERLIRYVTGMENIRDVIPYPRAPKLADF